MSGSVFLYTDVAKCWPFSVKVRIDTVRTKKCGNALGISLANELISCCKFFSHTISYFNSVN